MEQSLSSVGDLLRVGRVVDVSERDVGEGVPESVPSGAAASITASSSAARAAQDSRRAQQGGQRFETTGQLGRHSGRLQEQVRHQAVGLGEECDVQPHWSRIL